jgi:hypothetical protein
MVVRIPPSPHPWGIQEIAPGARLNLAAMNRVKRICAWRSGCCNLRYWWVASYSMSHAPHTPGSGSGGLP